VTTAFRSPFASSSVTGTPCRSRGAGAARGVLLPAHATEWSRDRLHVVLSHELAHAARGDWAVQLAAEGLRALHWFNPLSWIVCRRLRIESEWACDDAVLVRGVGAAQCAAHLLALARHARTRQPWLPAPAMARTSSLEGRIRAMLNTTLNRRPVSRAARTVTVAALLALTVAVGGLRAQSPFYALSGTVLDPTGRVLPGTRLVLTNATSGAKYEVKSDAAGRFQSVGLPPATYGLEASPPGFASLKKNVEIAADIEQTLRLELGSVHETINVSSQTIAAPPDPAAAQKREDAMRRLTAFMERERAKCAAGGAQTNIGGNILAPRKLLDVRPVYPEPLSAAGIGGTVTMDAVIGTDGLVRDLRNIKGDNSDLEAAAANAVRQWRFSTTLLNGEPIEVEMHVTTNFSIKP
jgi:TonB family protein